MYACKEPPWAKTHRIGVRSATEADVLSIISTHIICVLRSSFAHGWGTLQDARQDGGLYVPSYPYLSSTRVMH